MLTLDITQRRQLSAQGHTLNPVVIIGKAGLTNNVIEELDRSLFSHELIKVKTHLHDRNTRQVVLETICQRLNAAPIQHVGKIFLIYRPKPEETIQKKTTRKQRKTCSQRHTKRSYQ